MSIELIPKCEHCHQMGVSNGTFFEMVNTSAMIDIIGSQNTNDPVDVNSADAKKCKTALSNWEPPGDWGAGLRPEKMKEYFLEFFARCDGFTTR